MSEEEVIMADLDGIPLEELDKLTMEQMEDKKIIDSIRKRLNLEIRE